MKAIYNRVLLAMTAVVVMVMGGASSALAQVVPPDFGEMAETGGNAIMTNFSGILVPALVVLGAFIGWAVLRKILKQTTK